MSLFRWKPEYAVGIKVIDDQHKVLVGLINKLHDAIEDHFQEVALETILQELFDYTRYHFTTEEELMEQYGYEPEKLEKHKKQHQRFISELNSSQADMEILTREDAALIQEFLVNWLKNHILKIDTQLAEYLLHYEGVHDHEPSENFNLDNLSSTSSSDQTSRTKQAQDKTTDLLNGLKNLSVDSNQQDKKNQLIQLTEELADLLKNMD